MTKEMEIEIIMADNCTRKEAERHLKDGATIIPEDDFRQFFDDYMHDWQEDEEGIEFYRNLMETKGRTGEGIDWVEYDGEWYMISYSL